MKSLLKNRKGQGTTEYIVILAIVVGLAIALFGTSSGFKTMIGFKLNQIITNISSAGN